MPVRFTDVQIAEMLKESKAIPVSLHGHLGLRLKRGHKEQQFVVTGDAGNKYSIILRQSTLNVIDFSVILAVHHKTSSELFRLRRYNGKSHEHTNPIERDKFYAFHIHAATERYQELGIEEDTFAMPTSRFADFTTAIQCMIEDCGFIDPLAAQHSLFDKNPS